MQPAKDAAVNPGKEWQKTPFANPIRYVSSGTYYARFRVKGKLVRKLVRKQGRRI